ncbi:MAG TPA: hypothetical protein VKU19_03710 [Bryobacteraceae bacterium]|nr:hypothetical protein [Bryobacteraceae bacterium]
MPTQATYDDANLILRLYELRRDEKLRQARDWYSQKFHPKSLADVMQMAPPGSQENAYMRMVASYWETAASFVTSGVLNQELFFQSSGEMLAVYEKMRLLIPEFRAMAKNPSAFKNLETVGNAYIKWMESQGPEAYSGFQAMLSGMAAATAKK